MITQTGIVKITALTIEAANFNFKFNFGSDLANTSSTNEVIDWAIARLESERIPNQTAQEPK